MRGYPFQGEPDVRKVGDVVIRGKIVAQVSIRTAATPEYDKVLLVQRGNLAGIKELHGYHLATDFTFPQNVVIFDQVPYVFHRYDPHTQTCVFRPFAEVAVNETPDKNAEGGVNWPDGGDNVEDSPVEQGIPVAPGVEVTDETELHRLENEGGGGTSGSSSYSGNFPSGNGLSD